MGKEFIVVKYVLSADHTSLDEVIDSCYLTSDEAIKRAEQLKGGYIVIDEEDNLVYPIDSRGIEFLRATKI